MYLNFKNPGTESFGETLDVTACRSCCYVMAGGTVGSARRDLHVKPTRDQLTKGTV